VVGFAGFWWKVREIKPIVAHWELAARAGYLSAINTHAIVAEKFGQVGCIGAYMTMVDVSAAYAKYGYKREVVTSGKYKAMGIPGTSLSEEQRGLLQQQVDYISGIFKEEVRSNRGNIKDEDMQGQCFYGSIAKGKGLTDYIGDLETAIGVCRELAD